MTAPNMVSVSAIYGKTAVQEVAATATAIVSNSAASGKVLKVNSLYVSNSSASNVSITVDLYRSATAYYLAKEISVPANATVDIISKLIYMEEGDDLRLTASTGAALFAICSYEEMA